MRTASYSGVGIGILNAATPMTNDNREKTRSDRDAPSESPNLPETNAPKAKKPKTERESALIVRPRTQSGVRRLIAFQWGVTVASRSQLGFPA